MKQKRTKLIVLIAAAGLIFLLDKNGFLSLFKKGFNFFSGNVKNTIRKNLITPVSEDEKTKKELDKCLTENFLLGEENQKVRKMLEAGIKPTTKITLGKIIGVNKNQLLVVFDASDKKPQKGDFVIDEKNLIGIIEEAKENTVYISSLSSEKTKLPVKIWGSGGKESTILAEGILVSESDKLIIRDVLDSEKIKNGDRVGAVAKTGETFFIGEIENIAVSDDKVFKKAEVKPAVSVSNLLTVGIITGQ